MNLARTGGRPTERAHANRAFVGRRRCAAPSLVALCLLLASCGVGGASGGPSPVAPARATAGSVVARAASSVSSAPPTVTVTANPTGETATTAPVSRMATATTQMTQAAPTAETSATVASASTATANVACGRGADANVADPTAVHGLFAIVDTDLGAAAAVRRYLLPNPEVCGANFTVNWQTIDRGPGTASQYDWSALDAQLVPWEQAGKLVNVVFVGAAEGRGPQIATPSYVMKQVTVIDCGSSGRPTPVFWQPGYEKNWEAFMAAAVRHFAADPHVGYLRFGIGVGGEDFVSGGAPSDCLARWDAAGFRKDWAPYNQRLIAYEGALHSPIQLMIAINPERGKTTLADANAKQAAALGIGFGNQGLAADDVTAIDQGTPCPNADWCALFATYAGQVPLEEQTLAASDAAAGESASAAAGLKIGPNSPATGPLPPLLRVALRERTQIFELYARDLLLAFDPDWPGYGQYHQAYARALAAAAAVVGTSTGTPTGPALATLAAPAPSRIPAAAVTPHGGPLGALYDAIEVYQNEQGIPPANYQAAATVATTDPTWAYFTIRPTPAAKASLQGGYGYAHLDYGGWSVVTFGSAGVGCSSKPPVPAAIREEFAPGQPCP